jgi:hypothetical protein
MKMCHVLIPAIASLTLFAANSASALTPASNATSGARVEEPTGIIMLAKTTKWTYRCKTYEDMHARQRCYEKHGLNSNGRLVKSRL